MLCMSVSHRSLINDNGFSFLNDFAEGSSFLNTTEISTAFKSRGILKVLCKVQPPVKSTAAILLEAVANTILPSRL